MLLLVFISLNFILNVGPLVQFVKVENATLNVNEKKSRDDKTGTGEGCAKECLSDKSCLSFEMIKESTKCNLLKESAESMKKLKADNNIDYYQQIKRNYS